MDDYLGIGIGQQGEINDLSAYRSIPSHNLPRTAMKMSGIVDAGLFVGLQAEEISGLVQREFEMISWVVLWIPSLPISLSSSRRMPVAALHQQLDLDECILFLPQNGDQRPFSLRPLESVAAVDALGHCDDAQGERSHLQPVLLGKKSTCGSFPRGKTREFELAIVGFGSEGLATKEDPIHL